MEWIIRVLRQIILQIVEYNKTIQIGENFIYFVIHKLILLLTAALLWTNCVRLKHYFFMLVLIFKLKLMSYLQKYYW